MNKTRRKPTTGRQSPTLFDKWHGIFYMPSRTDEAGHTKAFDDSQPQKAVWLTTTTESSVIDNHRKQGVIDNNHRKQGVIDNHRKQGVIDNNHRKQGVIDNNHRK